VTTIETHSYIIINTFYGHKLRGIILQRTANLKLSSSAASALQCTQTYATTKQQWHQL